MQQLQPRPSQNCKTEQTVGVKNYQVYPVKKSSLHKKIIKYIVLISKLNRSYNFPVKTYVYICKRHYFKRLELAKVSDLFQIDTSS